MQQVTKLKLWSDEELIAELKDRGYRVAKADRIRTASVEKPVSAYDLIQYGRDAGWREHIHKDLGSHLGEFLMMSGALPVIEEMAPRSESRLFRTTATIVVDDPKFDWPYILKMEQK